MEIIWQWKNALLTSKILAKMDINCGVPQGSILGPQLFLLYINDLCISIDCQLSLYADDSALFFAHSNPSVIANRLSVELSSCRNWLIDNRLSLHVGKTECVLFSRVHATLYVTMSVRWLIGWSVRPSVRR